MSAEERRWTGMAALGVGLGALGAVVLGFVLDERLFEPDPSKDLAYAFAGGVALLATLAVIFAVDAWTRGSPRVRAPALAGLVLGVVALLGAALLAFGTLMVGG